MTFEEDTENLPAMTNDSDTHSSVSVKKHIQISCSKKKKKTTKLKIPGGRIVVNKHAIPPTTMVRHIGILRPIFSSITTLINIDGISTKPNYKFKFFISLT